MNVLKNFILLFLPEHVGNLKNPALQASHLSPTIFALHVHIPVSLHETLLDPCALQLQSENWNKKYTSVRDFYNNL